MLKQKDYLTGNAESAFLSIFTAQQRVAVKLILTQQFRLPGQTCDQSLTNFRIAFFLEDLSDKICIVCKNLCRDHQLFQAQVSEFEELKYLGEL